MLDTSILSKVEERLSRHLEDYRLSDPLLIIKRRENPEKWVLELIRMKLDRFEFAAKESAREDSILDAMGYLVLLENLRKEG